MFRWRRYGKGWSSVADAGTGPLGCQVRSHDWSAGVMPATSTAAFLLNVVMQGAWP
jgi:hypothetical protein